MLSFLFYNDYSTWSDLPFDIFCVNVSLTYCGSFRDNSRANGHLLTYSEEYMGFDYPPDAARSAQNTDVSTQWDLLKTYTVSDCNSVVFWYPFWELVNM